MKVQLACSLFVSSRFCFSFIVCLFVFLSNFYLKTSEKNADKNERRLGVIFDAIFKFKMIADKLTKHFSG